MLLPWVQLFKLHVMEGGEGLTKQAVEFLQVLASLHNNTLAHRTVAARDICGQLAINVRHLQLQCLRC